MPAPVIDGVGPLIGAVCEDCGTNFTQRKSLLRHRKKSCKPLLLAGASQRNSTSPHLAKPFPEAVSQHRSTDVFADVQDNGRFSKMSTHATFSPAKSPTVQRSGSLSTHGNRTKTPDQLNPATGRGQLDATATLPTLIGDLDESCSAENTIGADTGAPKTATAYSSDSPSVSDGFYADQSSQTPRAKKRKIDCGTHPVANLVHATFTSVARISPEHGRLNGAKRLKFDRGSATTTEPVKAEPIPPVRFATFRLMGPRPSCLTYATHKEQQNAYATEKALFEASLGRPWHPNEERAYFAQLEQTLPAVRIQAAQHQQPSVAEVSRRSAGTISTVPVTSKPSTVRPRPLCPAVAGLGRMPTAEEDRLGNESVPNTARLSESTRNQRLSHTCHPTTPTSRRKAKLPKKRTKRRKPTLIAPSYAFRARRALSFGSCAKTLLRHAQLTHLLSVELNATAETCNSLEGRRAAALGNYLAFTRYASERDVQAFFCRFPPSSGKLRMIRNAVGRRAQRASDDNFLRSLQILYAGGRILSQSQYQAIINVDLGHRKLGSLSPVPYRQLMKFVDGLKMPRVHELTELNAETTATGGFMDLKDRLLHSARHYIIMEKKFPGFIKFHWPVAGSSIKLWPYCVGADGFPIGDRTETSFLVTLGVVGRMVSSSSHCFQLGLIDAPEDDDMSLVYTRRVADEAEALRGKVFDIMGEQIMFECAALPGDQKWHATVIGEVDNKATFFSSYADVCKDTLQNTRWPVVEDRSVKEAFHPWSFAQKIKDVDDVERDKANNPAAKDRPAITKAIASRGSRQEFLPYINEYLYDKLFPDPLHATINGWKNWLVWLLEVLAKFSECEASFSYANMGTLKHAMLSSPTHPLMKMLEFLRRIDRTMFRRIERNFNAGLPINKMGFKGNEARRLSSNWARSA